MSEKKKGAGRPPKLPAGKRITIRCVLVNGEKERFDKARGMSDLPSQSDFTRASVLHAVDTVLGIVPATPKPKRKK